jgi:uncharacterized membrane protein YhaH (DUF805 family)
LSRINVPGRKEHAMGNLFSLQGRIGRQQYFLTTLAVVVVTYFIAFVIGFAAGITGAGEEVATVFGFLIGVAGAVVQAFLVVKRLHDLGKPGWHYWLFFVPLYNIYLGLVLLFTPGENGSNEYGPAAA